MLHYKCYLMVFVCLFVGLFGLGQDQDDVELFDISESFTVSSTTVEVVVTTKKGDRVTGLSQDDFLLTVDGRAVASTYFSEIRPVEDLSQGTGGDHVVSGASVPRNYLAFIDDYFSHPHYRARLFERLLENVDAMRPGDSMAVVRYSGKEPKLYQSWTSDRVALRQVLSEIAEERTTDMGRRTMLQAGVFEKDSTSMLSESFSPTERESGKKRDPADNGSSETKFDNEEQFVDIENEGGMSPASRVAQLERTVTHAVRAVELAMRGLPRQDGRNMLLLVSSGWPYQFRKFLGLDLVNLRGQDDGGEPLLRPVTDTANLLGYTIYPLLIGQISSGNFTGSSSASFADFNTNIDFEVKHDSLKFLADQTGGKLLSKAQFLDLPLSEVASDNSQYYVLGFSTTGMVEGERHLIAVTTKNKSYKVRHRKEFRARAEGEQGDLDMENVLLTGKELDQLGVTLGASVPQKRHQVLVPLSVKIPLDWTSLKPQGELYQLNLTLRVSAEDKKGNRADLVRAPIDLNVSKPPPGALFTYDVSLMLSNKKQRLVFSLEDEQSGKTLTTTSDFAP